MVDRIGRGAVTSAEAGARSLIENIMKAIDRKVDCFCEEHPLLAEIVAAIFGHILMEGRDHGRDLRGGGDLDGCRVDQDARSYRT